MDRGHVAAGEHLEPDKLNESRALQPQGEAWHYASRLPGRVVPLAEQPEEIAVRVDAAHLGLVQLGAPAHEGEAEEEKVMLGAAAESAVSRGTSLDVAGAGSLWTSVGVPTFAALVHRQARARVGGTAARPPAAKPGCDPRQNFSERGAFGARSPGGKRPLGIHVE